MKPKEHHNFAPCDEIWVWYTSSISGVTHCKGRAKIVGIDPAFEDQYFVRFDDRPRRLLNRERERERAQAGHELASMQNRPKTNQRDIVDMVYDDGLTTKEALELKRHHRLELAREFRQAVETIRLGMVEESRGHDR